ncbi:hypothetical protein VDGL01_09841 [Verticillium dahliae]
MILEGERKLTSRPQSVVNSFDHHWNLPMQFEPHANDCPEPLHSNLTCSRNAPSIRSVAGRVEEQQAPPLAGSALLSQCSNERNPHSNVRGHWDEYPFAFAARVPTPPFAPKRHRFSPMIADTPLLKRCRIAAPGTAWAMPCGCHVDRLGFSFLSAMGVSGLGFFSPSVLRLDVARETNP